MIIAPLDSPSDAPVHTPNDASSPNPANLSPSDLRPLHTEPDEAEPVNEKSVTEVISFTSPDLATPRPTSIQLPMSSSGSQTGFAEAPRLENGQSSTRSSSL